MPPMIPLYLRVAGFLSYHDPVELDFTRLELACISGPNGAGKSSLLDAMTWALFGQARRRDEAVINLRSRAAEVTLTFRYEGNVYRVQRSLTRGKTPNLEFQMQQFTPPSETIPEPDQGGVGSPNGLTATWRPLTERTLRETQARIESVLRLDYDTFVNASFFLQGRADQFAQQTPARRKEVLGAILDLGAWEAYRSRAAEERRMGEDEVATIDGRRAEIAAELAEEGLRRRRLESLEAEAERLGAERRSQETSILSLRKSVAALESERRTVETLQSMLNRSRSRLAGLESRFSEREAVRAKLLEMAGRADKIRAAHTSWQRARLELEQWEGLVVSFREHEERRRPHLEVIAVERARLEEELRALQVQEQEVDEQAAAIRNLSVEFEGLRSSLDAAEGRLAERARLQAQLAAVREEQASTKAENEGLRSEMETLRTRIEALSAASGASCPLCGQPLTARHRKSTLKSLEAEGKRRGDQFRANKRNSETLTATASGLQAQMDRLSSVDADRVDSSARLAQVKERLESLRARQRSWESGGSVRLAKLRDGLAKDKYALDARRNLAKLDRELARLGYDATAHETARRLELDLRPADEEQRGLESALARLAPLEDEISALRPEITAQIREIEEQESDLQTAQSAYDAAAQVVTDLAQAEEALATLQEAENAHNQELGAARQKVLVLDDLRRRDAEYESSRQSVAVRIGHLRALERAFGRDGLPALLIEQALPQIETKANELLDRLSDGRMSIRFVTQAGYKDRKREDLRETLDLQISDGAGFREYELFSGGEAFRINFAVRLALSEVLAARKGARLQTLVIDEGFGSQDDQGRQRLIEAINLVKKDFALVLVITHLDQLKDAFPTRIEVEKTSEGSKAWIV